jgi:hypothetical protein
MRSCTFFDNSCTRTRIHTQAFAARIPKWRRKGSLFGMSGTDVESIDEKKDYSTHEDESDGYFHDSFNTNIHVSDAKKSASHAHSVSAGEKDEGHPSVSRDPDASNDDVLRVKSTESCEKHDSGSGHSAVAVAVAVGVAPGSSSSPAGSGRQHAHAHVHQPGGGGGGGEARVLPRVGVIRAPMKHADYLSLLLISPVKGDEDHLTAVKFRAVQDEELRQKQELMGIKAGMVRVAVHLLYAAA